MKEGKKIKPEISIKTLLKVLAVLAAVYLLYLITDIVATLFVALIFASAIEPFVKKLESWQLPRVAAVSVIYLVTLSVVGLLGYLVIPPIVSQVKELADNLPTYINRLSALTFNLRDYTERHNWPLELNLQNILSGWSLNLQNAGQNIIGAVSNIFGGLFSAFLILVITFYLTMEEESFQKGLKKFLPARHQRHATALIDAIQQKIGWWFRGQLSLCFIIFLMTYISLTIFGVKYALVLAIIAGFFEIIPYLGPTLSAVPAALISFIQSPLLAVFVIMIYVIIQAVENNILVPKVMQKAVGLDPIVSIIALMVGFELGGVIGAILAIPVTTALMVIIKDLKAVKLPNN